MQKEHLADKVVMSLCEQLENRFVLGGNANKTADLADWIEYSKFLTVAIAFASGKMELAKLMNHRRLGSGLGTHF